ncbi:hypothetical protein SARAHDANIELLE_75 [Hafnia phage vB_HpaM_SarahDanielle]|uniref:Uncharacterized protein n=1 Tax=Hafnia phage vB_HpaM_SarahDanielle TaxID=2836113 RepID=A0AAE7WA61_9CAUD|nr:hypothetical protein SARAHDANIELLE_75 [Hafnia phage vB_HpaM_SarahDanielle]
MTNQTQEQALSNVLGISAMARQCIKYPNKSFLFICEDPKRDYQFYQKSFKAIACKLGVKIQLSKVLLCEEDQISIKAMRVKLGK